MGLGTWRLATSDRICEKYTGILYSVPNINTKMPRSMMLLTVLLAAFAVVPTTSQAWTSSSSKAAANALSSRIHDYISRTTDRRRLSVPDAADAVRFLQVSATTAPGGAATSSPNEFAQCLDDTAVNFDDAFSQAVYGSAYQATCSCAQDDNTDELTALFDTFPNPATSTPEEIDEWTTNFNELFGNLSGGYEYSCESGCATCFEDEAFCGYLASDEKTTFSGLPTNFTYEEIASGLFDFDPSLVIDETAFDSETCITYESGETGELCFSISYAGDVVLSASTLPNCTILYNDVPCNSCESTVATGNETCYVADCTNVDPDATLDSCAATGFVGPFRFLQAFSTIPGSIFTVGTCRSGQQEPPDDTAVTPVVTEPPLVAETDAPNSSTVAPSSDVETPSLNDTQAETAMNVTTLPTNVTDAPPSDAPNNVTTANETGVAATNGNSSTPSGGNSTANGNSSTPSGGNSMANDTSSRTSGASKVAFWSRMMMVPSVLVMMAAIDPI